MHFHLPKPLHGWREFAGEVGIILLGVLLALLGQAMFEEWTWDRKVEAATSAMDDEIKRALADTLEADRTAKCGGAQLDFIQSKLIAKDWSVARAPVIWALYNRHFYGEDAYTSAVASQVAEHLGQDKLQKYAGLYTQNSQDPPTPRGRLELRRNLRAAGYSRSAENRGDPARTTKSASEAARQP